MAQRLLVSQRGKGNCGNASAQSARSTLCDAQSGVRHGQYGKGKHPVDESERGRPEGVGPGATREHLADDGHSVESAVAGPSDDHGIAATAWCTTPACI